MDDATGKIGFPLPKQLQPDRMDIINDAFCMTVQFAAIY